MGISFIMVILYLVFNLGVSAFSGRKATDTKKVFLASGSMGTIAITALTFSEFIAGGSIVGNATSSYAGGLSSVWISWGSTVGIIVYIFAMSNFARFMYNRKGVMSLPETVEYMFDRKTRVVVLLIGIIGSGITFSTMPMAAAAVVAPILGVSTNIVALVIGILFTILTLTCGLKGISWLNIVNSLIMYGTVILIAVKALSKVGGISALQAAVPETYFSVLQPSPMVALAGAIGAVLSTMTSNLMFTRINAGKTYKGARFGIICAALMLVPFALLIALTGMTGNILMPGADGSTIYYIIADGFSPIIGGLAAMAVVAACFSTAPLLLLDISNILTRDFYRPFVKPDSSDKEQLRFSRIMTAIFGIVLTVFGLNFSSILKQVLASAQIRSCIAIVLLIAFRWKRVTKNAAFSSILIGGIFSAAWYFVGNPFGVEPLWPGAVVTIVLLVVISLCDKGELAKGYELYHQMLAEEKQTKKAGQADYE